MADFTFLDVTGFKARTLMPPEDVDLVESAHTGWLLQKLADNSAYIISRLSKRYGPFVAPYPVAILRWLEQLTTGEAYFKRGGNPSDEQFKNLTETRPEKAEAELKEAADSKDGLFDLPLRSDTTATGVVRAGPLFYSEASPYEWTDVQAEAIRNG